MVSKRGGKDVGQKKITGFFAKPAPNQAQHHVAEDSKIVTSAKVASSKEAESGQSILNDVTNSFEESVQSPTKIITPEDTEVIERTPEVNVNKRKFRTKMRKNLQSKVVGEGSKRKIDSDDRCIVVSPVSKKNRCDPESRIKIENTKKLLDDRTTKSTDTLVEKLEGEPDQPVGEKCSTPPPKDTEDDMGDLWACFEDSPFKASPEEHLQAREDPPGVALGRHKVLEVRREREGLVLSLESCHEVPLLRTVTLRQSWATTAVCEGDKVHLEVDWQDGACGVVEDSKGTIVVQPDMLVSSTAVVSALFCMRKAVLAEKFKGMEGGNRVMLLGTIVHELLQEVLKHKAYKRPEILKAFDVILAAPKILGDLVSIGMSEVDMRKEVEPFVRHIQYFVDKFILGKIVAKPEDEEGKKVETGKKRNPTRPQWEGRVSNVIDIEENLWSPRLGMKGKIDLTVETNQQGLLDTTTILPLEVKTGKPTYSTSHQGQVIYMGWTFKDCCCSGDYILHDVGGSSQATS